MLSLTLRHLSDRMKSHRTRKDGLRQPSKLRVRGSNPFRRASLQTAAGPGVAPGFDVDVAGAGQPPAAPCESNGQRVEVDTVRSMVAVLIVLCLAGCGSSSVTSPDLPEPTPHVTPTPAIPETWIIWGQSNALGCAEAPGNVGGPGVVAWASGAWIPASEPLPFMEPYDDWTRDFHCDSGWAVTTANLTRRSIRLTGHAAAATRIGYWLKHPDLLLRNLVDAKDAKWMIAYQGESDALHRSETWASDFRELVGLVRGATNPRLRVLVIGLADSSAASYSERQMWNGLRGEQRDYVASDPLAVFISAEGLELQADGVHLTRAGYAALATRVAAAIR